MTTANKALSDLEYLVLELLEIEVEPDVIRNRVELAIEDYGSEDL
jgi:hypothetical protein